MRIFRNKIRMIILAAGLALSILICGVPALAADKEAQLGSPDFSPSPERPVGWRGDGSGRYPAANPPVSWGSVATSVKGLRSQATKPKEGETGMLIPDGVIREWLVLGPISYTNMPKDGVDFLPGEAQFSPAEGDKVGDLEWKKVTTDTSALNFKNLFNIEATTQAVAYACAYVYSDTVQSFLDTTMTLRPTWSAADRSRVRFLYDGREKWWGGNLEKGWHRLLFRVTCGSVPVWGQEKTATWSLRVVFFGEHKAKYEEQNIAWKFSTPSWSAGQPVIAGDKIFVTGEPRNLYCINKQDGKLLWARTATFYDSATDEEKKANPEVFKELEPLAAQLKELDAWYSAPSGSTNKPGGDKGKIEAQIAGLMSKVDPKKYPRKVLVGEGGISAPVPVTDGKNIYALFQSLLVCYDLEGNRKWSYYHQVASLGQEHGYHSSPVVIGGKVVIHVDRTVALDAATGKKVWELPLETGGWPAQNEGKRYIAGHGYLFSSSLLGITLGNEPLLVTILDVVRARDGKVLASLDGVGYTCPIATPVVRDGVIYRLSNLYGGPGNYKLDFFQLPASAAEQFKVQPEKRLTIAMGAFPKWNESNAVASPLYHDGLIYCVSDDGVLSVVDAVKREIVYQKLLDADLWLMHNYTPARGGMAASPTLAGKYIYFFGNRGTCVVIEPGRTFKQVAKNQLHGAEASSSCPVFEGRRMYYRALNTLYCIEEKN